MPQEQPRLYTGNSRSNPGEKLLLFLQSIFVPGRFTAIGIGNDGWSWLEGKGDVQRPEELFGDVERGGAANLPHKTGLLQLNLVCHEHLVVSMNAGTHVYNPTRDASHYGDPKREPHAQPQD